MPTTTLLAACNEVLINIGEAEVTDLASPVGKKVRLAMQNAIRTVGTMHNWLYLQTTVSVVFANWLAGVAVLPPIQEVYTVWLGNDIIKPQPADQLNEALIKNPMAGSQPLYYSRVGENKVLVYPEPSTANKPLVQFRVLLAPQVPSLAADTFTLPDDVYDIVSIYAQMLMHRNHTTDMQAMQACASEFEMRMHMLRSRDQSEVVSTMG